MKEEEVDQLIEKARHFIGNQVNVLSDNKKDILLYTFARIGNKVGLTENDGPMLFSVNAILSNNEHGEIYVSLYNLIKYFESRK